MPNFAGPETDFPIPMGFRWGTAEAKIRYTDRPDLAMVIGPVKGCSSAAVFTQNKFAAPPVLLCRQILAESKGRVGGIVVNSGCANAATGDLGMSNAQTMGKAAQASAKAEKPFFVCSTGTIGVQLPIDRIVTAMDGGANNAGETAEAFTGFASAILTTDTRRKIASAQFSHNGRPVTIVGCAKGAGMMQPNMATMLSYIFTDASAAPELLQEIFEAVNERSLNCVTVDGDTSTNDTAILLASGESAVDIGTDSKLSLIHI